MNSEMKSAGELSLPPLSDVFRKQRLTMLGVFVTVFTAIVAVILLLPKRYESTMKVLVKKERADLFITPGHAGENGPLPQDVSEADLNSEVELLRSIDILRPVVLQCGLAKREINGVQAGGANLPVAEEKALRKLQKDLQVNPVRKSNIIQISYVAYDPPTAAAVLRTLADRYLNAHLALHGAPGTYDFFSGQASRHEQELNDAENRLRLFSKEKGLFVIDEQKDLLLRQITEAQSLVASLAAQLRSDNDRIVQARQTLKSLSPRIVTLSRTVPNQQSVERLHTMIAELRNRKTDALTRFRPEDRVVVDLEKQISDTQTALEAATKIRAVEQATDVNPLTQELDSEIAKAEIDRASARAKLESAQSTLTNYHSRLATLTSSTTDYDTLTRRAAEAKQTYLLYKQKQEEARVAESLDRQKIANVAIAETPREAVLPSSPNVKVDLIMGCVFAMFVSVLTGWTVESYFSRSGINGEGVIHA
jgi:uncharacterized protein involved in exopolysaccharide biosynthesis